MGLPRNYSRRLRSSSISTPSVSAPKSVAPKLTQFPKYVEKKKIEQLKSLDALIKESESKEEYLRKIQSISPTKLKLIEIRTRDQSSNALWFIYRKHVISASIVHRIYHASLKRNDDFKILALIAKTSHIPASLPALQWGMDHEDEALRAYQQKKQLHDPSFKIKKMGLVLDPSFAAWAGSPDGIGIDGDGSRRALEAKCPFSFKDRSLVEEGVERLQYLSHGPELKKSHIYYYQVQTVMGILKLEHCDFIVWCPTDMFVMEIKFDPEFYERIRSACIGYYKDIYLEHIFKA